MDHSRRSLLISGVAAAALCASGPVLARTTGPTPVERHGRLQVQGSKLVDQHGQPVTLRGMSLFWSQWGPRFYNADAIAWLRSDWKVNCIRAAIAVPSGGYLEHPEAQTARAEAAIDAAIAQGIYIVVDWHAHDPEPAAAIRFFEHIATKYGSHPNIIYETWNEPLEHHDWPGVVKPYHQQVIPRIRAIDPDNLIVAGTPAWSQDVDIAAADPLDDPNLAYVLHYYATSHGQSLRDKAKLAMDRGAALFVTEYGITEYTGDGRIDEAEMRAWWDFLELHGISHMNWSLNDKRETSAALVLGAPSNGGWTDAQITRSGRLVRDHIRALND